MGNGQRGRALERDSNFYILFFLFFVFFLDLQKSDRRFSSEQKAKLIYPTRATRGHQNLGVSSNYTSVDPTRSTDRRNSLLKWKEKCENKMWVDFLVLENPSPRRNGFTLESPLTFIFIFKWGKPSKNKKPQ